LKVSLALFLFEGKAFISRIQYYEEVISMAEVLCKCGIKREPGYLYFIDKQGNCARAKMSRGGKKNKR